MNIRQKFIPIAKSIEIKAFSFSSKNISWNAKNVSKFVKILEIFEIYVRIKNRDRFA